MPTYEIKNDGARPRGFRVRGGIETVKTGQSRVIELSDEFTSEELDAMKTQGIKVTKSSKESETEVTTIGGPVRERRRRRQRGADDPAETGGVVSRSSVSEQGGVNRAAGDTTTTTKPTEKQAGAKA